MYECPNCAGNLKFSSLNVISLLIPVLFATLVYYVVAYITSRKMKKLSPNVLIQE